MKFTNLGRTDLRVSRLCLGTMTFGWPADERTSFAILDRACDAGINFLDTADIYSSWVEGHRGGESETIIGRWLKAKCATAWSSLPRCVVRCGKVQMAKA